MGTGNNCANRVLHVCDLIVVSPVDAFTHTAMEVVSIDRIAPSASHMFGGDHKKLENVVKLNKDLGHSSRKGEGKSKKSRSEGSSNNNYSHGSSYKGGRGGCRGKSSYGNQGYGDRRGNDKGGKGFCGGNSYRGRKDGN